MLNGSDVSSLRIDAGHPSLPGHFPGQPIVPGVLLLERVLVRAEECLGRRVSVAGLPVAKFTQPLLPGEEATLQLELIGAELKFEITRDGRRIAQGAFRLNPGSSQ